MIIEFHSGSLRIVLTIRLKTLLREPDCEVSYNKFKRILDSEWSDECNDFTHIVCTQHI